MVITKQGFGRVCPVCGRKLTVRVFTLRIDGGAAIMVGAFLLAKVALRGYSWLIGETNRQCRTRRHTQGIGQLAAARAIAQSTKAGMAGGTYQQ